MDKSGNWLDISASIRQPQAAYQLQQYQNQLQYQQYQMADMQNRYEMEIARCNLVINDLYSKLYAYNNTEILPERVFCDEKSNCLYYTDGEIINGALKERNLKPICRGVPVECTVISYDDKFDKDDELCILWSTNKKTIISLAEPDLKKWLNQVITLGAAELLNKETFQDTGRRIFSYIMSESVKKSDLRIDYNAGWYIGADVKATFDYFTDDYNADNLVKDSGKFQNRLYVDEKRNEASNTSDVMHRMAIFKNKEIGFLLILFLVYSLLQFFFRQIGTHIDKIVLITGNADSINKTVSAFLQIYNTNSVLIETLTDKNKLLRKLFNSKDDIVLLSEKQSRDRKEQEAKEMLLDIVKDDCYTFKGKTYNLESLTVVIGEAFSLETDSENSFIILNIEDDDINENVLLNLDKREIPTFVMNFTKYVSEHDIKLTEKIENKLSCNAPSELECTDSKKLYAILTTCFEVLSEYISYANGQQLCQLAEMCNNPENIILDFTITNEKYSSVNDACEIFKNILEDMVENCECVLVDNKSAQYISNPEIDIKLPVIYVDKRYIYISEDDVKKHLEAIKEIPKFFNLYITALKRYGYLNCTYTKYCARPVIRHPNKKEERRKMLAISKEFLDDMVLE